MEEGSIMTSESRANPDGSEGILIEGWCEPDFAPVKEAFATNLEVGDDLGASVAVYLHGRCVVDLTGGLTAANTPYPHDALHVLYSATKGVTSLCLMQLAESGQLRLDARVTDYWPEFACRGKDAVTVRQLLSHQAGLTGFTAKTSLADFADWHRITAQLAAQAPFWAPGTAHGYHALTFGLLAGELIRLVSGKMPGTFLHDEFAAPHGLDLFLGLPTALHGRVTPLFDAPANPGLARVLTEALLDEQSLTRNAFTNPPIDTDIFNQPSVWELDIPSVSGVSSARSLAAIYASTTAGPLRRFSQQTIDDFRRECVFGPDRILIEQPTRFGAGFMLPSPREPMLSAKSFGHNGRGGSLAFADPESGVAFAYLGNRCLHDPTPHSRLWRLLTALRDAL
jgi:CubicO group peptidase (beta-lactamase class C family)